MKVDLFDFDLPASAIAQHPVRPRDHARLLVIGKTLHDAHVRDLGEWLKPGDILVTNDTRVIPARLSGMRNAARIEVTLHKQESANTWRAFARPAKKLKPDDTLIFADDFSATITAKGNSGEVTLQFNLADTALMDALHVHGIMPLPPYIKRTRDGEAEDLDDYQTLFARAPGAVAAPTAGLHFTPELMSSLATRGVQHITLTLHVGAGTFLPVKVDDTSEHVMHAEWGEVTAEAANTINTARKNGGRIVAVGTTAMRLLESAADDTGTLHPFRGETDIFITPGYPFKMVDVMMTNFHLPRSTLFMLVSAFGGLAQMHAAYAHAIETGYRFYSYGDACLIFRADSHTDFPADPQTAQGNDTP